MYFTPHSMLPENQQPLIITVAPFGPQCLPADDSEDIAISWEDQVQKAVDCYNAGATVLHVNVGDPKAGHTSKNFADYSEFIGLLRDAVPKMILQVDGSTSLFAPEQEEIEWLGHKPDQVTVHYQNTVAPVAAPFYIERLKRLRALGIQPHFRMAHIYHLEELEYLIRAGVYMAPVNHSLTAIGGSCFGRSPFDFMEYVRRSPDGSLMTMESSRRTLAPFAAMSIAMGVHVRCGVEDNMGSGKGERLSSVQQIDQIVRLAKELKRPVATGDQAREISKLGVWYNSVEETLNALGLPPNRKEAYLGLIVMETVENQSRNSQKYES